jgi:hydroxymethylglutaryl-CoA lyase
MSAPLPDAVRIREVGPRDGFQNEPEVIPTGEKVRLIGMLADSGLRRIELTSFVRPDVIPQLADATEVLASVEPRAGVAYSVLIPNRRGLDNALSQRDRFQEANFFLSASETHNRKNVNRSIAESLSDLEGTIAAARDAGIRCEGVISVSFGCPYEGEVPAERVFEIAEKLAGFGCEEVAFGDTTGMANPRQVREFFAAARERLGGTELTAHFHNTRGPAMTPSSRISLLVVASDPQSPIWDRITNNTVTMTTQAAPRRSRYSTHPAWGRCKPARRSASHSRTAFATPARLVANAMPACAPRTWLSQSGVTMATVNATLMATVTSATRIGVRVS